MVEGPLVGLVASHLGWTGVLLMALLITALGILFYGSTYCISRLLQDAIVLPQVHYGLLQLAGVVTCSCDGLGFVWYYNKNNIPTPKSWQSLIHPEIIN
jgi:hypothetical protein